MGVVYLAEHVHLERKVALKILAPDLSVDDEFRQRFLRESQMAARVEHPNIIPVYDAGESDDLLYIAMRYVGGMDLKSVITAKSPLDFARVVHVLEQVASALDAAHTHGLVHRDVKPGNILIEEDGSTYGHVYLTDFGLTKLAGSHTSVTKTGMFLGSIDYAAPEQWEGRHLDGRTDIYALGCVAFECLTGIVPYKRETALSAMHAHLMEPPPTISEFRPGLPASVDAAVRHAMAKSSGDRPATCLAFVEECRAPADHPAVQTAVHPNLVAPQIEPVAAPPDESAPTGVMQEQHQAQFGGLHEAPTAVDTQTEKPRSAVSPVLIGLGLGVVLLAALVSGAYLLTRGGEDSETQTGSVDEDSGSKDKEGDGSGGGKQGSKNGGGGSGSIPISDLRIVYRSDAGGQDDLFIIDGKGNAISSIASPSASETDPAWSRNGTQIAFESDADGDHDIYVIGAAATSTAAADNITDTPTDESNPAWSPDDSEIAFNTGGGGVADIFVVGTRGGAVRNITTSPIDEADPNWSPDGSTLVFESGVEGARDILSVEASGSVPAPVATPDGDDIDPEWSPDGTQVAFSSDGDIFVVNGDGTGLSRVTDLTSVDTDPAWSPDGRRLAFEADDGTGSDIFLVAADGGRPVALTKNGFSSDPAFAPE